MTAPAAPAPGYYTDPLDPDGERWWDGSGWTEAVRAAGAETAGTPEPADEPAGPSAAADDESVVPRLADVEAGEIPQLAPSPREVTPVRAAPRVAPAATAAPAPVQDAPPEPDPVSTIKPGFYPDPYGQAPLRWWDGGQWTTATSQPGAPAAPSVPASSSAPWPRPPGPGNRVQMDATLGRAGPSTVLPMRGGGGSGMSSTLRRVGLPGLAAVLVLVAALGVRLFVLHTVPDGAAPAQLAAAINLHPGDLPTAWKAVPGDNSSGRTATTAPKGSAPAGSKATAGSASTAAPATTTNDDPMAGFDRDIARCIGAADPATAVAYDASSPSWSRGSSEISSEVVVLHSAALAQQDLRARQGNTVDACMRRVGVPAMRAALAPSGVVLTGLAVQKLPGAAADTYALRLKMTATVKGRPTTVWTDTYGFVRGKTEIGLTVASVGAAPDRVVAADVLRRLRARAADPS